MKKILITILIAGFGVMCNGQPNTITTIEVGIVDPQPEKHYEVFLEVKADSLTSQLIDGMDYLDPDVSNLIVVLANIHTVADTLFGEVTYPDLTYERFVKGGLVQVDNSTLKYSAMRVSYWTHLDIIEANSAGFFIRRK